MFIAVELARSNCYYGAWALSTDAPELPTAAATCRVSASQAFMNVQKKIFKLMEAWVSLGNLIVTFITEDVVNLLPILAVKQFGKIN